MAVSGMMLILLAFGVLILPLRWMAAILAAAAIHELCHRGAIWFCGGQVRLLRIGAGGARMEVSGLSSEQELLCALAGPLGGFVVLLFARWFPRTAVCGGFQSLFNLLPIYPLDGGRMLRCLGAGKRLCAWIEGCCLAGILCLGVYGTFFLKLGILPLGTAGFVLLRAKSPCKAERFSVQ